MHQNAFGGRTLPGPAGGAPSAPPDPLAVFNGRGGPPEREGKWGRETEGEEGGEGKKGGAITITIWRNDRAQLDTQHGSQIYEHIHQWHCLLSDEYRPNGYSDGTL